MSLGNEPDWDKSDDWDEFQWEQAFKYSEKMSARYFRMLSRFGDFPNAERLIAAHLGDTSLLKALEEEEAIEMEFEISKPEHHHYDDDDDELDFEPGEGKRPEPGDPLFFEGVPLYVQSKQVALGWTNVLSNVLEEEDRLWGLQTLFALGRILSYMSMAIGDGIFEPVEETIALGKRVLHQINIVLGIMAEKEEKYGELFGFVREQLLEVRDGAVNFLMDMRDRREDTDKWK
jgi:hypothetical protein